MWSRIIVDIYLFSNIISGLFLFGVYVREENTNKVADKLGKLIVFTILTLALYTGGWFTPFFG